MNYKFLFYLNLLLICFPRVIFSYVKKTEIEKTKLKDAYLLTDKYKKLPEKLKNLVDKYAGKTFKIGDNVYYFYISNKGGMRKGELTFRCNKNNQAVGIRKLLETDIQFNRWVNGNSLVPVSEVVDNTDIHKVTAAAQVRQQALVNRVNNALSKDCRMPDCEISKAAKYKESLRAQKGYVIPVLEVVDNTDIHKVTAVAQARQQALVNRVNNALSKDCRMPDCEISKATKELTQKSFDLLKKSKSRIIKYKINETVPVPSRINNAFPRDIKMSDAKLAKAAKEVACDVVKSLKSLEASMLAEEVAQEAVKSLKGLKDSAIQNTKKPRIISSNITTSVCKPVISSVSAKQAVVVKSALSSIQNGKSKIAIPVAAFTGAAVLGSHYFWPKQVSEEKLIDTEQEHLKEKVVMVDSTDTSTKTLEQQSISYTTRFSDYCTHNPGTTIGITAAVAGLGYGAYKLYKAGFFSNSKKIETEEK